MTSPIPVVVVCVVMAYTIASVFLAIFSFSADAILQCFLLAKSMGKAIELPKGMEDFEG